MKRLAKQQAAAMPRAGRWMVWLCLLLAACSFVGGDAANSDTDGQVQVLRRAEATISLAGCGADSSPNSGDAGASGVRTTTISLPHYWDRAFPGRDGRATYRLGFRHTPGGHDPPAFYLARAANSFEMRLNGKLLASSGDLCAPAIYGGRRPLYVPVPEAMLQADNELLITIAARADARGGLSQIAFGPGSQMRARNEAALGSA